MKNIVRFLLLSLCSPALFCAEPAADDFAACLQQTRNLKTARQAIPADYNEQFHPENEKEESLDKRLANVTAGIAYLTAALKDVTPESTEKLRKMFGFSEDTSAIKAIYKELLTAEQKRMSILKKLIQPAPVLPKAAEPRRLPTPRKSIAQPCPKKRAQQQPAPAGRSFESGFLTTEKSQQPVLFLDAIKEILKRFCYILERTDVLTPSCANNVWCPVHGALLPSSDTPEHPLHTCTVEPGYIPFAFPDVSDLETRAEIEKLVTTWIKVPVEMEEFLTSRMEGLTDRGRLIIPEKVAALRVWMMLNFSTEAKGLLEFILSYKWKCNKR